jgi:hypothetical protein
LFPSYAGRNQIARFTTAGRRTEADGARAGSACAGSACGSGDC